jgi:dTDP-3-amino-3,4,6-trideoxy-alpha-D-glucose transaminase
MGRSIPLVNLKPCLDACRPQWERRLAETIEGGSFILGEQVAAFEREFAAFCGAPFAVGVGSGSGALEISLRLAGIRRREQEVITSPLTAPFTAQAILAAGATPVFSDIDPETLLLDPRRAAEKISPRTAAILPVHLYGQACSLELLAELARDADAVLLQDACQAHGAVYDGRSLSAFSGFVAYSFYPTKNLGCLGDGGALVLNDSEHDRLARLLRDGGRAPGHVSLLPALHSRLDEIQAALLRVFLERLGEWNCERQRIAAVYDRELAELPPEWVRPVGRNPRSTHVRHLYVVRVQRREELAAYLASAGIGTGVHYPVPLHRQPAFQRDDRCPEAERACAEILSLPLWPYMPEQDVRFVASRLWKFYLG